MIEAIRSGAFEDVAARGAGQNDAALAKRRRRVYSPWFEAEFR